MDNDLARWPNLTIPQHDDPLRYRSRRAGPAGRPSGRRRRAAGGTRVLGPVAADGAGAQLARGGPAAVELRAADRGRGADVDTAVARLVLVRR